MFGSDGESSNREREGSKEKEAYKAQPARVETIAAAQRKRAFLFETIHTLQLWWRDSSAKVVFSKTTARGENVHEERLTKRHSKGGVEEVAGLRREELVSCEAEIKRGKEERRTN